MKKEFKVYSPLTKASVKQFTTKTQDGEDSERILLEGIASTTNRDLQDEIVSAKAIESMAEQAYKLNIHANHWYGVEDVIGAIKESQVEDNQLHIKFLITKKHTPDIQDLLDTGVNLGLSIGGAITNYDEKNRIINAIELYEISLTPMPANWDTFGTVTTSKGLVESNCLTGACYAIVKTLKEEDNMETEKMETHKEEQEESSSGLTQDEVIALINEYMAEKEETIAQEITDKVESQLEAIVDAKIKEALDEEAPAEENEGEASEGEAVPAEGEGKANSSEQDEDDEEEKPPEETNDTEDEEDDEESSKGLDIAELIKTSIDNALGDDFADKVAAKMWGDLDNKRTTKGSKYNEYMKKMETPTESEEPEPVEKSTYSSKEAAQILLNKQKTANPIMAAAMKNLE